MNQDERQAAVKVWQQIDRLNDPINILGIVRCLNEADLTLPPKASCAYLLATLGRRTIPLIEESRQRLGARLRLHWNSHSMADAETTSLLESLL